MNIVNWLNNVNDEERKKRKGKKGERRYGRKEKGEMVRKGEDMGKKKRKEG